MDRWEYDPWAKHYYSLRSRCKHWRYRGRGIENHITKHEVKQLWFRDNACLMKQPSVDRIDTYGNYTFDNCRFIELKENKSRLRAKSNTVLSTP